MKKEFIEKVIRQGSVDTKVYRYTAKGINGPADQFIRIQRIRLPDLDTTAAIDGWETVCEVR